MMAEKKLPVQIKGVDINTPSPEKDQYNFLSPENDISKGNANSLDIKTEPYHLNMEALYKKLLKKI